MQARHAPTVTLRPVDADNVDAVIELELDPDQEGYVASNAVSLAQAMFAPEAWFRAIYADDELVGFVMLSDDTQLDPQPPDPELSVWRLMIDRRHQGRGLGRLVMQQLIDYARSRRVFRALELSVVPGPRCPEPFYRSLGFVPTGRWDDDEMVMALPLHPSEPDPGSAGRA